MISLSSRTKMSMLESNALPLWAAAISQACATCLDSECSSIASSSRDRSLKATTVATTGMNLQINGAHEILNNKFPCSL